MKQPLSQLIIVGIIMIVIITLVIVVYIFRFSLFGPKDLTLYGSRTSVSISACNVEGKTEMDTKCTDIGKQVTINKCVPNSTTGYMCWDGQKQVTNSEVRVDQCLTSCRSFIWNQTSSTPCLIENNRTPTGLGVTLYAEPTVQWCTPNNNGFRIKTYSCNRIDGSGSNLCTFNCNGDVYNPDCYSRNVLDTGYDFNSGSTLLYRPDIIPNNSDIDITLANNIYIYEPKTRASSNYPGIIPASTITTRETCSDLNTIVCGNYPITNYNNNPVIKSNCKLNKLVSISSGIGYNGGFQYDYNSDFLNTPYDLFEPGTFKNFLTCYDNNGSNINARCDPKPGGCIELADAFTTPSGGSNNILKIIPPNGGAPTPVCGIPQMSGTILTGVTQDPSTLNPCIASNPNFSLAPNSNIIPSITRRLIDEIYFFSSTEQVFGVPLFMRNTNSYLSLYNNPCPEYTITNNGGKVFNFTNNGSFLNPPIDDIPPTGLPFRFDCKGNPAGVLSDTPCTWIQDVLTNAAGIYGVDPSCNIRNNNISPIMEQTSLIIMVRPAELGLTEFPVYGHIKCNLFVIQGSNMVGWLTYTNNLPGYGITGTPTTVLSFRQGRFDSYGNATTLPGSRVENITNGAFYLRRLNITGTDYSYKLYTPNYTEIQYINNGVVTNLDTFYFSRATTSGVGIVNNGVIDDTGYSNLLYSRGNTGITGCNALLSR